MLNYAFASILIMTQTENIKIFIECSMRLKNYILKDSTNSIRMETGLATMVLMQVSSLISSVFIPIQDGVTY